MKTFVFSVLFLLCTCTVFSGEPIHLNKIINEDGTINLHSFQSGTIDFDGYFVELNKEKGPVLKKYFAPGWNALGTGVQNNTVFAMAVSGGNVYIGGDFTNAGGNSNADRIAYWDGSNWNALGNGLNNSVRAITISGSKVYAGGRFTNAGGNTNADRIAYWDGSNWNALGTGLNGRVRTIAINGSTVYAGGNFNNAGGNTNADRIAYWDGSNWNALGTGLNNTVRAITISGSNVYTGGSFTNAGGNTNADRIAYWDGSNWNALGNGLNNTVRAITISGSNVYTGGSFTNAGGNANADRIAYWDGSNWNALGTGLNGTVRAIKISGSAVYAGGQFTNAGGNSDADRIAYWDGSAWIPLSASGVNNTVFTLDSDGTDIYAGGDVTNAGGNAYADRIARWKPVIVPVILVNFYGNIENDNHHTIQWEVASETNFSHYELEQSTDGLHFKTIQQENGSNSSSYSFTNTKPENGNNYYRLKMADIDGSFSYSNVIRLSNTGKRELTVYPNPAKTMLTIEKTTNEPSAAFIYSYGGSLVQKEILSGKSAAINISNLKKGSYVLMVTENGESLTKRFIKK